MKSVPKLRNLYLYLTDACNLYCKHCWVDGSIQKSKFIEYELLKDIIPILKEMGLSRVNLTGGEPTLHPELLQIIKLFHDYGISQFLTTNGMLITKEFCKEVNKYKALACSVSLDGALPSTHDKIRGMKGAFNKTINGIKNLIEFNIPFEVIFALQKSNYNELVDVIELADSLGVKVIRVNFLLYGGGDRIKQLEVSEGKMDVKDILRFKGIINMLNKNKKIKVLTNLPFSFYEPQEIFLQKKQVCGMMHSIGILPDGNISICGVGQLKKELIIGKAMPENIQNIWENDEVIKKIRFGIPSKLEGVCGICNLRNICCGSCIAQNYLLNGSIYSSCNLCEALYKENLFPQKYLEEREFLYEK